MESQVIERAKPKWPEPLVGKYFRAVIAEAHELRLWLEALKVVHDEPTIIANYGGIRVRQMDPSRIRALHFEVDRYVFDEFDVSLGDGEDIRLAVAVDPILRLLRGVKRGTRRRPATRAEFGLNEEQKLWLRLYNGYSQEVTFSPLEPDEPFGELKVPFTARIMLDARELLRAIKDLVKAFGAEFARITIDSDGLHITAEDWDGHEFKATFGRIDDTVLDLRVDEPATAIFDATELLKILKVGTKLVDIVEVELATNKPIRLGFKLPYSAILDYYMAPRVEAE
mgnify:CR=1 FL=1